MRTSNWGLEGAMRVCECLVGWSGRTKVAHTCLGSRGCGSEGRAEYRKVLAMIWWCDFVRQKDGRPLGPSLG